MYTFIINPGSSSGNGLKVWNRLEKILLERDVAYRSFILKAPGEAGGLAARLSAAPEPGTLVLLGGDGTINEFINGLTSFKGITLGIIPTGSGNDFVRGIGSPTDPEKALRMILAPKVVRSIDIGTVTSGEQRHRFAVSSGIGYDAAVCYEADRSPLKNMLNKMHTGKFIYLYHALRMLFSLKRVSMRVLIDDRKLRNWNDVFFAAAMNTRYEGGGFMFSPKADPSDGMLDLIVAEGISKPKALLLLPAAFFGKHVGHRGIHLIRCRRAVLGSDAEACVHTDGEHFGFCKKIIYETEKEKLQVICS